MGMFSNGIIKSMERTELKKSTVGSKLRTLWALGIGKENVLSKNMELCKLKRLRVSSVSFKFYSEDADFMKDWLDGIASLLHLVYLKMEGCGLQYLPDSVGNLLNLQILCLSYWYNLEMLPPTITKLDKLTSFDIEMCLDLKCMPDGIERLSRLERLVGFRPTISSHKNTSGISHLKNLGQLRELLIYFKSPNDLVEGELNVLSELQNLRHLAIQFDHAEPDVAGADADAAALVSKVNHQLSPLRNVEELRLFSYAGESTPIWLNATTFPNLQFLGHTGGDNIKHMDPGFWEKEHGVWKIEGVELEWLPKFEEKRERFHEALPSLKTLIWDTPTDGSSEWTDDIIYLDESGDVIFSGKGIRSVEPGLDGHVMVGSMKKPFSNASAVAKMVEIVKRWKWGPEMETQLDKLHFVPNLSHVKQALSEIREIDASIGLFGWAKRQSWYSPKDEIYVLLFDRLNQNGDFDGIQSLFDEMIRECGDHGIGSFMAYNRVIQHFAKAGKLEVSFCCSKKVKDSGCQIDTQTYNSLITLFLNRGLPYKEFEIYEAMEEAGCSLDFSTFELMIPSTADEVK
ncbi:hypothetical protein MRB53_024514 [Persea americana]|uniref:Uncharacterized protein n=1 Tax=Persea americana TaxID=3435 RepID=A0ACC2LDB2_PERAE|nr:hypothetical protein MRB53_024514 [Persea americana]